MSIIDERLIKSAIRSAKQLGRNKVRLDTDRAEKLIVKVRRLREDNKDLEKELEECKARDGRLPGGMEHCTIISKQCEKGHGWLTAKNWIQHGCPTCEKQRLDKERDEARRELCELEYDIDSDYEVHEIASKREWSYLYPESEEK